MQLRDHGHRKEVPQPSRLLLPSLKKLSRPSTLDVRDALLAGKLELLVLSSTSPVLLGDQEAKATSKLSKCWLVYSCSLDRSPLHCDITHNVFLRREDLHHHAKAEGSLDLVVARQADVPNLQVEVPLDMFQVRVGEESFQLPVALPSVQTVFCIGKADPKVSHLVVCLSSSTSFPTETTQ